MKIITVLFLIVICLPTHVLPQFKVIGYVPVSNYQKLDFNRIQFTKLTHLNIAFINPDSTGRFNSPQGLDTLISLCHASGVKVLASFGGDNPPAFLKIFLKDSLRSKLIDSMVNFIVKNQLDGEDVDLEDVAVDKNYAQFINELGKKLKQNQKIMSAAIATYYASRISNNTIAKFDFINIMSYDYTGPWTPKEPGQHSPFIKAIEDLNYYIKIRKIPKNKVILGVPFYGYEFNKETVKGISYKNITENNSGSENNDSVKLNDTAVIYYNGITTIRKKINLAFKQGGGIMIWQLYQDTLGKYSLLNNITNEIDNLNKTGVGKKAINNKNEIPKL